MNSKAPAFQCYAADELADMNVLMMTTEEFGAYWFLKLICWRQGSLPNDPEALALLSKMPADRFQISWEKRIRRCFEQQPDGEWIHPGLEEERKHQAENREKKRHAALTRHHPTDAMQMHGTRNADAVQMECPSASSSVAASSAASVANPPAGDRRVVFQGEHASGASAPSASSRRPASGEANGEAPKRKPSKPTTCDEAYLDELQTDPAFKALDVYHVYAKMVRWCKTNHKQPTRKRLEGWLMREDKPISTGLRTQSNGKYSDFAQTRNTAGNDVAISDWLASKKQGAQ
jgi:uncharacterized protein YdaU (DUF1376 family)